MNRRDDTPVDEAELMPYLEGKDGVSAAYRTSSTEVPSAALDAAILQAARAALQTTAEPAKTPGLRNYYSLAASLMLGMMLGAVFFRDGDDRPAAAFRNTTAPQVDVEQKSITVPVAEQVSDSAIAAEAVPPASPSPAAAEAPATFTLEAPRAEIDNSTATVAPAEPQNETEIRATDQATTPVRTATAENSGLRERVLPAPQPPIATIVAPPASPDNISTLAGGAQAQSAGASNRQLEEIMVTGSRIMTTYREDQQAWLQQIARLTDQLDDPGVVLDVSPEELDDLRSQLESEREEFRLAFPDVDLNEALENLREQ